MRLFKSKLNCLTRLFDSIIRLFKVNNKLVACSAIAYGEYAGTLATFIPTRDAALKLTLSCPTDRKVIYFTPKPFNFSIVRKQASSAEKIEIASKPSALIADCDDNESLIKVKSCVSLFASCR